MDGNHRLVLRAIYQSRQTTRPALLAETGLSANRLALALTDLEAQGLVQEIAVSDGQPGRPVGGFSIAPDVGRVIGLDIGGQYSRAVLCDLRGRIAGSVTRASPATAVRSVILGDIVDLVGELYRVTGAEPANIAAAGVGVRGIVDARTGTVLGWPNTPLWAGAWTGVNLIQELRGPLGLEMLMVEDSVRAMAVNAHRKGPARDSSNFLYVFLGTGVGSALLVDGRPYYGGFGLAGELGHVTVQEDGPWCSCGNRGCLEVMASTSAVMQRVHDRLTESYLLTALRDPFQQGQLTLDTLIGAARIGDKVAFQVLDEAGTAIGKVVAIAINLLGPELVVLGGPLTQGDGIVEEAVRRQVRLRGLQHIASRTRIVTDDGGELAGAVGAALLATDSLFASPDAAERLLQRAPMR